MIGPEFQLSSPVYTGRAMFEAMENGLKKGLDRCWIRIDDRVGILASSTNLLDVTDHPLKEAFPNSLVTYLDSNSFQTEFFGNKVASFC